MKLQEKFEKYYEKMYGVKPVFLVESKVYALHNQQIAYECFCRGYTVGFSAGLNCGWDDAKDMYHLLLE